MQLPCYDQLTLSRALSMRQAIDAMRSAFAQLSSGDADVPVRTGVEGGDTLALFMPGWLPNERALGTKVVTVTPGNAARGLPQIHAVILMSGSETGRPRALLDGTWLTALRTGAASGLATELLSRPESEVLAVVGAGVQARTQIQAVLEVRAIREIRVHSRSEASARKLLQDFATGALIPESPHAPLWAERAAAARWVVCDDSTALVDGADVVVTATNSSTPVLPERVSPGTHINAVGAYTASMRELPTELIARATVFVDQRAATLEEAGDLIIPISEGRIDATHIVAELGEVVLGRHGGRSGGSGSPSVVATQDGPAALAAAAALDQITVFKSVGSAAQDLAVAARALSLMES